LEKVKEKRFEDDLLKELEARRITEAKNRFRNFVVNSDMNNEVEMSRLLSYFCHR
jgi:hypothetical protein